MLLRNTRYAPIQFGVEWLLTNSKGYWSFDEDPKSDNLEHIDKDGPRYELLLQNPVRGRSSSGHSTSHHLVDKHTLTLQI